MQQSHWGENHTIAGSTALGSGVFMFPHLADLPNCLVSLGNVEEIQTSVTSYGESFRDGKEMSFP